jgi:hypothetical protein
MPRTRPLHKTNDSRVLKNLSQLQSRSWEPATLEAIHVSIHATTETERLASAIRDALSQYLRHFLAPRSRCPKCRHRIYMPADLDGNEDHVRNLDALGDGTWSCGNCGYPARRKHEVVVDDPEGGEVSIAFSRLLFYHPRHVEEMGLAGRTA